MGDWLRDRLPEHVDVAAMLDAGRFVDDTGRAVRADDPYAPHRFVWFHRDLRDEPRCTRRSTWSTATNASSSSTSPPSCPRSRAAGT